MNTTMKFTSLVVMALSMAACATPFQESRRWVEEVKLADGRIINVEREEFLGRDIPLVERNTLSFKTEDGKQIRWESCAKPIALDFVKGRYILISYASFSFCTSQLKLPYDGGWAAWRLAAQDSGRIENTNVPRNLTPNLVYISSNAAAKKFIRHEDKRGDFHVEAGIGWCVEAWIERGNLARCSKIGGN